MLLVVALQLAPMLQGVVQEVVGVHPSYAALAQGVVQEVVVGLLAQDSFQCARAVVAAVMLNS